MSGRNGTAALRMANPTPQPPTFGLQPDQNDPLIRSFLAYAHFLGRYHQYQVRYLERLESVLRQGRRVVLVSNHAFDVIDPLLFTTTLIDRCGCMPYFIGHENVVFNMPGWGDLARRYHVVPSRHMDDAVQALRDGGVLMLYPGSGSEAALRNYREEPYRLKWDGRLGFLQLALRCDAELIFLAAVGIDEMYYQSRLDMPQWLLRFGSAERYAGTKMQFGTLGPHLFPTLGALPVQITHVVSEPIDLGNRALALKSRAALLRLHRRVAAHCQLLLNAAVAQRDTDAPLLDRTVRAGERLLQRIGV